ncbi:hypothetical protein BX616_007062 [Lobosporangium transversale]|uniref:R3H-associated N-terminal domain-containing protein n=1 Tax=Lobosporangium transversale TaxID=64571 RepID=A0A1Y2GB14_9FUNG|nr:hypothetical protein BCR41DRAFT_361414 [Lobosporangium transversale]KAF9919338.1 hypothetical protein BX616_007062 [Lobosporangium transversale]ORZ05913.1 hypothetical protein BCR41DRAFT_361414 [Lobosporangium transversale]|eukprot:XP_021877294.1 hypothetical protein BCR41DRAFT_361414 [Lobosporangium transversale]
MDRHPRPTFVGDSIHGQSKDTLMKLHQKRLEKTINESLTMVDNDKATAELNRQQQQRAHNKKKKKFYQWIQRDSQAQRDKIGLPGSRRRQRHDNDKFVYHPLAVLYQVDLPFPGYNHDVPSFHWKYDATIESLISNNPPSSLRSKLSSVATTDDVPVTSAGPMIGHHLLTRAQRKDIKKAHVPQGIVMQYEGELVSFLNQLTLSDNDERCEIEEGGVEQDSDFESSSEQADWVFVQPSIRDSLELKDSSSVRMTNVKEKNLEPNAAFQQKDDERPQIYLRWDIQDQFLRFVAHALCAFYGLISFSKTAVDGKRLVYICHPTHLDSIGELSMAPAPAASSTLGSSATKSIRPKPLKRQNTLEHVQEMPLYELDQLWNKIEPIKIANCLRPDMTFFEYLYPSTRPIFS